MTMIRKFYRMPAACLCIAAFLCSCGQSAQEQGEIQIPASEASSYQASDTFAEDTQNPPMKVISSKNGIIASGMIGNEQGCYEIFYRPAGDGNILYTDYASQNRIYLSSQVTGTHTDSTDTSWLPSTVGGCYLTLTDENLILFKLNTPAFADDASEEAQGYIARYDLNGSERRVLTQLAPNETIADGCIVSDSNNLYYLEYFVNEDGSTTPAIVTKLNIRTGEREEICELSQDERHFIVGTYKDKIILKNIVNPVNAADASSAEDIINAYRQQVHEITLLSADGRQQSVCTWKQDERSEAFDGDTMYYWDNEKQALYRWDFETSAAKCLYSDAITGADGTIYTNLTLLSEPYDQHLLVTAPNPNDPNDSVRLAYDLQTNKFSERTLTVDERDVEILAEGAELFLVRTGLQEYPVTDYAPDGQEIVTEMLLPAVCLMEKEDYWDNLPNYIPIQENVYK